MKGLIVAAVKAAAEPAPAVAAATRGPPLPQVRRLFSSSKSACVSGSVSLKDAAWTTQAGEGWVLCDDLLRSSGGIRFGYSSPQVRSTPLCFPGQANNG